MTYETVIQKTNVKVDLVVIIDGIPVLFGERAGRTHDGVNVTNPPAGTWTSYEAIVKDSVKLGDQELDWDSLFCKPAKVSFSIASNPRWNMYFEGLRGPIDSVATAAMTKAQTTVPFMNSGNAQLNEYCYINRETILLGGALFASSVTGCTRNCIALPGSRASKHEVGDPINTMPAYMTGRRVTLRFYAGTGDTNYVDWTGYRIAASPEYDQRKGTWDIVLDDGMSTFAVPMAMGALNPVQVSFAVSNGENIQFRVYYDKEVWSYGDEVGGAIVRAQNGDAFVCKVESVGTLVSTVTYATVDIKKSAFKPSPENADGNTGFLNASDLQNATIQRIYISEKYPMRAVLKALLSREGDGTNDATWDTMVGSLLDGANPPADETREFCMGANLDAALVDVSALEAFANESCEGWTYFHGAKQNALLLDLLEDAAWALGGIFLPGTSGLTFRKLQGIQANTTIDQVITESTISVKGSSLKAVRDESTVLHTATVDCNFDPIGDDAKVHVSVIHNRTKRLYRDTPISQTGAVKLERRSMWVIDTSVLGVLGNAPIHYANPLAVRQQLQRIFVKRGKPIRRYSITLPWRYSVVIPGDRVTLTHTLLNAFDGSYLSSVTFDVVGIQRDWNKKTVTLKLDETTTAKLIAPALRIDSYAANVPVAGQATLTLSTSNATWGGGTVPASYFQIGWSLAIHDRSSSPMFSTTSTHTITGGNGIDTLEIGTLPGFTPVAGDVIQLRDYDNATAVSTRNQAQNAAPSDFAFLADANYSLGASSAEAAKWG